MGRIMDLSPDSVEVSLAWTVFLLLPRMLLHVPSGAHRDWIDFLSEQEHVIFLGDAGRGSGLQGQDLLAAPPRFLFT